MKKYLKISFLSQMLPFFSSSQNYERNRIFKHPQARFSYQVYIREAYFIPSPHIHVSSSFRDTETKICSTVFINRYFSSHTQIITLILRSHSRWTKHEMCTVITTEVWNCTIKHGFLLSVEMDKFRKTCHSWQSKSLMPSSRAVPWSWYSGTTQEEWGSFHTLLCLSSVSISAQFLFPSGLEPIRCYVYLYG